MLQRATGLDRVAAERHAAQIRDDFVANGRSRSARLLAIALLIVGLTATVAAAQETLPGDALYGVKRGSESVRLFLELDEAGRDALHVTFAQRRRSEAERRPAHATTLLSDAFHHLSHVETLKDETAVVAVSLVDQVDLLLGGQLPPAASDRARFALARARREIASGIDLPPVVAPHRANRGGEDAGREGTTADSGPASGASPSRGGGPPANDPGGGPPASAGKPSSPGNSSSAGKPSSPGNSSSAGKPTSPGNSSSGAKSSPSDPSDTAPGNSNASSNSDSSGSSADAPSPPGKLASPGPPDDEPDAPGPGDDGAKPDAPGNSAEAGPPPSDEAGTSSGAAEGDEKTPGPPPQANVPEDAGPPDGKGKPGEGE